MTVAPCPLEFNIAYLYTIFLQQDTYISSKVTYPKGLPPSDSKTWQGSRKLGVALNYLGGHSTLEF